VGTSLVLLAQGRVRCPHRHDGLLLGFADGTTGRVYRETLVTDRTTSAPCLLVVRFRLRLVRGRGHRWFRVESLLNTPLFVGFPGFVSKLWLAHDERGYYRGVYEWDGATLARHYALALRHVLALVGEPGSIDYRLASGLDRDTALESLPLTTPLASGVDGGWWRVVDAVPQREHGIAHCA
jgi:hypothetical protein